MAYHHSVQHYHSPFKLEHRNATAFPDPRSPAQRQVKEAAERQMQVLQSYVEAVGSPRSPRPDESHTTVARMQRAQSPRTAVPGMMPGLADAVNANSDHFWGARMSPSRMTPGRAEAMIAQLSETGLQGPIPPHDELVLSREDSHNVWMEQKYLRFGVHRQRRVPYVSRDEYVDPLRCTSATNRVGSGWISRPLNPHHPTSRFGAVREEVACGSRRAPPHAQNLPEKVTWHDPTRAARVPGEAGTVTPPPQAVLDASGDRTLRRLPATVLLTEVEERLRYHGMGSLLDVRFASDEAISALLRDCGFTPTQRMTILWELRKRYPLGN